jgi:hypothetical protein
VETCLLLLLGLRALLGEEHGVDVGEDAARGDRDLAQELVQLLVVADGELDVARDDARLLVVARGVARELEDLGRQVLEDRGQVDRRAGADARRDARVLDEARDAADGELQARLGAARDGLRAARLLAATT